MRPRVVILTFVMMAAATTGCSNVIRSGLMNSNTIFLDPNTNRTIYTQLRNTSENQQVTLSEVNAKLTAKGYQLVNDPEQANYWIQAKVIYCHKASDGVTPESVAKAGPGAGVSSGGTAMASASSADSGGMGMGGMPDMSALMRQAMAMSGGGAGFGGMSGFPGMQPPPKEDGLTYLCVADVQITDRKTGKSVGRPAGGQSSGGEKVQRMRMVGHVRQKSLDIPEATPIVQEKIATGIAGLF
ncbi:MAG: complement resistance protein TraT [Nitrospira sp.]|nr:complement resistance protein TraT [Nitrospira sp.]